jgi:hypothetical protein
MPAMTNALFYVAAIACLAVLAVLGLGLASFARGGADRRWSNKLMQLRVGLQFVAVLLILAFVWTLGGER